MAIYPNIRLKQAFRGDFRCPVCGGAETDPRRVGRRCFGFMNGDGWVHCSRVVSRWADPNGQTWGHPPNGGEVLAHPVAEPLTDRRAQGRRREALRSVMAGSTSASHADAEPLNAFLARRGLAIAVPPTIRFHRDLPYFDGRVEVGRYPAMLSIVEDIDGRRISIHRTYLTEGGEKAAVACPRKLMPPVISGTIRGCAVRLEQPSHRLAVCEGIETGMAFQQETAWATWAAISAGGLANVIIPGYVQEVAIAADNDEPGIVAAYALRRRLLDEGRAVRLVIPPKLGQDWNDVLMGDSK